MHCGLCLPSLVLTAQVIFLSECGHTDTHTHTHTHHTHTQSQTLPITLSTYLGVLGVSVYLQCKIGRHILTSRLRFPIKATKFRAYLASFSISPCWAILRFGGYLATSNRVGSGHRVTGSIATGSVRVTGQFF